MSCSWLRPATILLLLMLHPPVAVEQEEQTPTTTEQGGEATHDTSVTVVVDNSSGAQRSFKKIKKAVSAFLAPFNGQEEICLFSAGGQPALLKDFTTDPALVSARVEKLEPTGKLALYETLKVATEHVRSDAAAEHAAIVVFFANPDFYEDFDALAAVQTKDSIPIHVIAVATSDQHTQEKLQQLAAKSGGTAYFPGSDRQLQDVAQDAGQRLAGESGISAHEKMKSKNSASRKEKPLARYDQLRVLRIQIAPSKDTTETSGGENLLLQEVLVSHLQKAKIFSEVIDDTRSDAPALDPAASAEPGNKLDMLATIVEYRHGNRLQRQLIGWRGGAKFKVQVLLVDSATRKPVMSFMKEGSSSSGLFGGSQESVQKKAMLDLVNGIVKTLRRAK